MAETLTANYSWTKPDPGGSPNTWGSTLNADLDKIDAQVFVNQQAGVPVGSGALWFTNTPPANWLICNGAALSTTTYAALFAVLGYSYGGGGGAFNLPSLVDVFPFGAGDMVGLAGRGGEVNHTLAYGEMPAHGHNGSQAAHSHYVYQDVHSHYVYQDAHSHGASQDAHNHTVGGTLPSPGAGAAAGSGAALGTGTTSTAQPALHIDTQQPGVHADNQQPAVHVDTQQPAVYIDVQGSSAPHNNMPPYIGLNFIIKYA